MTGMQLDLGDPASLPRFADAIHTRFPGLNVLVANAGISSMEDIANDWDMSAAEAMVETNILGTMRMVGALLPGLKRQPDAVIMATTSNLAYVPKAIFPTYWGRPNIRDTNRKVAEAAVPV